MAGVTTAAGYYGTCFGYNNAGVLSAITITALSQVQLAAIDVNSSSFSFTANHVGNGSQVGDITGQMFSKSETRWSLFGGLAGPAVFDGFILSLSAGNITGEISVYGLAN